MHNQIVAALSVAITFAIPSAGAAQSDVDSRTFPITNAPLTVEAPWVVGLSLPHGWCSGSVLSERWIITAAHCIVDAPQPGNVSVFYAAAPGRNQLVYEGPVRYHPYPDFSSRGGLRRPDRKDDIGLIELMGAGPAIDLSLTGKAKLYSPPAGEEIWIRPEAQRRFTFIGWGRTDAPSSRDCAEGTEGSKRIAKDFVLSRETRVAEQVKAPLMDAHACGGDSGAPYLVEHDGDYIAFAVHSGRNPGFPVIGTATQRGAVIRAKHQWINQTAGQTDEPRRMICPGRGVGAERQPYTECSMVAGPPPEPAPSPPPGCPPGQMCSEPGTSPGECRICIPSGGIRN